MKIDIPAMKRKKSNRECVNNTLAFIEGRKSSLTIKKDDYSVKVSEELAYYPYWILTVDAYKARPFNVGRDAKRTFHITCDATEGSFIVLPNTPKVKTIDVSESRLLVADITEKNMRGYILREAVEDRINRQFIFGKPRVEAGALKMIYLPVLEIQAKRKDELEYKTYFGNIYTGEIKA